MTPIEWLAFFVLLLSALAAGAVVTISNGAVARAVARVEATYRRQKSQQLEFTMRREMAARLAQLHVELKGPDAWLDVVGQLLTDAGVAFDGARLAVSSVAADPNPCLVVTAGETWRYVFTTADPARLRAGHAIRRRDRVVPLDATLSPYARIEAQALWDHFSRQRPLGRVTLPRDAAWHLVVQETQAWKPRAKRRRRKKRGG
jgi:hypothetical protein